MLLLKLKTIFQASQIVLLRLVSLLIFIECAFLLGVFDCKSDKK